MHLRRADADTKILRSRKKNHQCKTVFKDIIRVFLQIETIVDGRYPTRNPTDIQWVDKKKWPPHYNAVVVYKMQKVPKQFKNTHGAVQINSK